MQTIVGCHYVKLLIFLTILGYSFAYLMYNTHLLKSLRNTDYVFYFIARNFFSIYVTFLPFVFAKYIDHISHRFLKPCKNLSSTV